MGCIRAGWRSTGISNLLAYCRIERGTVYIILIECIGLFIWYRERIEKMLVKYWLGRDRNAMKSQINKKFSEIRNNPAFLASYKMRDNPKYKILYHALALFESHMRSIRQLQRQYEVSTTSGLAK